ncbi:hypothetical protein EGW08_004055 [Elysia chlorotica]|uniref:Uncharacterized protein n=1 Tax=Elysia chlorotica TaxID=188477 RepID=A0A433U322_ELYCH|nr:hypothetical protein EGW08_004055 [Elysia chlorotica]
MLTAIPIPRAILSQMTSPTQQGALFSSLAFVETAGTMFASVTYTLIYNATLNIFKGAVFVVMAILCCVNISLLGLFWWVRSSQPLQLAVPETNVVPTPTPKSPSSHLSNGDGTFRTRYAPSATPNDTQDNSSCVRSHVKADENTPLLAT